MKKLHKDTAVFKLMRPVQVNREESEILGIFFFGAQTTPTKHCAFWFPQILHIPKMQSLAHQPMSMFWTAVMLELVDH